MPIHNVKQVVRDLEKIIYRLRLEKKIDLYSNPWEYENREIKEIWNKLVYDSKNKEIKDILSGDLNSKARKFYLKILEEKHKLRL